MNSIIPNPANQRSVQRPWVPISVGIGLTLTLLVTERANACSQPACRRAKVAPIAGTVVPANAPALYFVPSRPDLSDEYFEDAGAPVSLMAVLLDQNNQEVAFRTQADGLVFPEQPLNAGESYTWQYPEWCANGRHPDETLPIGNLSLPFSVTEPVALPTSIGTVKLLGPAMKTIEVPTTSGSCTSPVEANVATVRLEPSDELRAYLPLATLYLSVREPQGGPVVELSRMTVESDLSLSTHSVCKTDDESVDEGLPEGVYDLQVIAEIVGVAEELVSDTLTVELRCEAAPDAGVSGEATPDAGLPANPHPALEDAGVTPDTHPDSSTQPITASDASASADDVKKNPQVKGPLAPSGGGCATIPAGLRSSAGGQSSHWLLVALVGWVASHRGLFGSRRGTARSCASRRA